MTLADKLAATRITDEAQGGQCALEAQDRQAFKDGAMIDRLFGFVLATGTVGPLCIAFGMWLTGQGKVF